jgi:hypothetical protein
MRYIIILFSWTNWGKLQVRQRKHDVKLWLFSLTILQCKHSNAFCVCCSWNTCKCKIHVYKIISVEQEWFYGKFFHQQLCKFFVPFFWNQLRSKEFALFFSHVKYEGHTDTKKRSLSHDLHKNNLAKQIAMTYMSSKIFSVFESVALNHFTIIRQNFSIWR